MANLASRLYAPIFGIICCAFLGQAISAAPLSRDLILEGKEVVYDHNFSKVDATGNVVMVYQGITLNTQILKYSVAKKYVYIPVNFTIKNDSQTLNGSTFTYDMALSSGNARQFDTSLEPWYITGEKIILSKDMMTIIHARLTTCEHHSPDYSIRSDKIRIYTKKGSVVAEGNTLEAGILPFGIWFPPYILDNNKLNPFFNTPIPNLGATTREGGYAKQKYPYFNSPDSSGDIDFGVMSRLGIYAGVTHRFILDEGNYLTVFSHTLGSDGIDLGAIYQWKMTYTPSNNAQNTPPDRLGWMKTLLTPFASVDKVQFSELRLSWVYGELAEESRVDKVPYAEFDVMPWALGQTGIHFKHKSRLGYLTEHTFLNNTIKSGLAGLYSDMYKDVTFWNPIPLQVVVAHDGRWYQNSSWQRVYGILSLQLPQLWLNPRVDYVKRLYSQGESPFEFEKKFAIEFDELGVSFSNQFGIVSASFDARYLINTGQTVIADLTVGYLFHCWKNFAKIRLLDGQFQLGVEFF